MKTIIMIAAIAVGLLCTLAVPPVTLAEVSADYAAPAVIEFAIDDALTLDAGPGLTSGAVFDALLDFEPETVDQMAGYIWCQYYGRCPEDYAPEVPEEKGDGAERKPFAVSRSTYSTA